MLICYGWRALSWIFVLWIVELPQMETHTWHVVKPCCQSAKMWSTYHSIPTPRPAAFLACPWYLSATGSSGFIITPVKYWDRKAVSSGIAGNFLATSTTIVKWCYRTLKSNRHWKYSFHCCDLIIPVSFGWSESRAQPARPSHSSQLCVEKSSSPLKFSICSHYFAK